MKYIITDSREFSLEFTADNEDQFFNQVVDAVIEYMQPRGIDSITETVQELKKRYAEDALKSDLSAYYKQLIDEEEKKLHYNLRLFIQKGWSLPISGHDCNIDSIDIDKINRIYHKLNEFTIGIENPFGKVIFKEQ